MPERLMQLISGRDWLAGRDWGRLSRDGVDILLVAFVIYRVLLVVRGTRAQQMSVGLAGAALLYLTAKYLGLVTLTNLVDLVLSSFVLILVIVFQSDLRRALMRVGEHAVFPGMSRTRETKVIDEVVAAATELARHRIGALIAFEQNASLDQFVASPGIPLDAHVSQELLVTIFQPEAVNKLHDGSVIVRDLKLTAAGVFFPMPEAKNLDPSLGSRHRAALGITDETDAVVIVVSEERGAITVCFRGNMIQGLDGARLRTVLLDLLGYKEAPKKKEREKEREPKREAKRAAEPLKEEA